MVRWTVRSPALAVELAQSSVEKVVVELGFAASGRHIKGFWELFEIFDVVGCVTSLDG